jgi:hypothetical protein
MPILVTCPACGQSFSLRDELAGRSVRCRCGRPLAIPGAGAPNVLGSLLETELSRPAERPPERKAPVHRAEAPKSSAPPPPAHKALAGGFVLPETGQAPSGWGYGLRIALRSLIGATALCYGLLMLWWGACVAWLFLLAVRLGQYNNAILWFHVVFVGIALTGSLMSVMGVGVLIGRKDAGPRMRFAALILVMLWAFFSALMVIGPLRAKFDQNNPSFPLEFWLDLGGNFLRLMTWAIAPLLIFLWCQFLSKRDLTA